MVEPSGSIQIDTPGKYDADEIAAMRQELGDDVRVDDTDDVVRETWYRRQDKDLVKRFRRRTAPDIVDAVIAADADLAAKEAAAAVSRQARVDAEQADAAQVDIDFGARS